MGKVQLRRLLNSSLMRNILALYGLQFANYLLPLITIPYLARVLGPSHWGLVAIAQSFGAYIILIVEFGFNLSATREVARHKGEPDRIAELVGGVLGAKLLLAVIATLGALVGGQFVRPLSARPQMFWVAVIWAVGQAFNMTWYFQGREQLRTMATIDISAKAVSTLGLFLFVRGPNDAWIALLLQAMASCLGTGIELVLAHRDIPLQRPTWSHVHGAIEMGWTMFLTRSSVSLYTTANALLLGIFASPTTVGYYAGAEKIVKVTVGLMGPVTQALYPRLSYLAKKTQHEAAKLARISGLVVGFGAVLSGSAVWLLAPYIVKLILGSGFEGTGPVLRILVFILPCNAVSNILGIQWMLPLGMDRQYNRVLISAGVLNVLLAFLLGPKFGHIGMAIAVSLTEALVAMGTFVALKHSGMGLPWQRLDAET